MANSVIDPIVMYEVGGVVFAEWVRRSDVANISVVVGQRFLLVDASDFMESILDRNALLG